MGETKHILKRSEQKKENMWSTEDIFASDEAWKAEFAAIKGEEQALAVYAGRLSESPKHSSNISENPKNWDFASKICTTTPS